MSKRARVAEVLLWLLVLYTGIEVGGGLYELRVLTPVYLSDPPESIWRLQEFGVAHPDQQIRSGPRFWLFTTPFVGILAVSNLAVSATMPGPRRKWLLIATLSILALFAFTYFYFVPTLIEIMDSKKLGLAPEIIRSKAHWWTRLNWVRLAAYFGAWLAALRSLTIRLG